MNIAKLTTITAALSATILLNAPRLVAQDAEPSTSAAPSASVASSSSAAPSGSPAADKGNRRGNMEDFRARINERLKEQLKVTDDEWTVIQPLLEKVQTIEFTTRFSGMGGMGRRGGGNNQTTAGAAASPSPANRPDRGGPTPPPEVSALRTALETDGTSTDDIKAKLQALRESRKKSAADLAQAREDLKKVLTLRQEAVLVSWGILE